MTDSHFPGAVLVPRGIEALFTPFNAKALRLPNRIVMAPMTRRFSPLGVPPPEVAAYYRRRAEGQVGLIVTEGTAIGRPGATAGANVPDFCGEGLAGWQRVVEEVHDAGGAIAPQLWHVGVMAPEGQRPEAIDSPSGVTPDGECRGRPMSEEAIAETIAAFARAAGDARTLGFDAVELHGAHCYLLDQFLWEKTNRRTDRWGGATLPERGRFVVEVVKAVRQALGPERPLILRLSQWKPQDYGAKLARTPEEMRAWLEPLAEAGADVFHCSQRRFWEPEFEGSDLNFAGWAKKLTGKVTITVGSVGLSGEFRSRENAQPAGLEELVRRLERGDFDLVAVGRALLADPQWAVKVRQGRQAELKGYDASALETLS
jgi:2,4-dienoyl-CoA reductase-like NADH-dependent reductase (Old Yellow Enzyme family)